jgi:hypothetical protein
MTCEGIVGRRISCDARDSIKDCGDPQERFPMVGRQAHGVRLVRLTLSALDPKALIVKVKIRKLGQYENDDELLTDEVQGLHR